MSFIIRQLYEEKSWLQEGYLPFSYLRNFFRGYPTSSQRLMNTCDARLSGCKYATIILYFSSVFSQPYL